VFLTPPVLQAPVKISTDGMHDSDKNVNLNGPLANAESLSEVAFYIPFLWLAPWLSSSLHVIFFYSWSLLSPLTWLAGHQTSQASSAQASYRCLQNGPGWLLGY
jgi:hypothetical protein